MNPHQQNKNFPSFGLFQSFSSQNHLIQSLFGYIFSGAVCNIQLFALGHASKPRMYVRISKAKITTDRFNFFHVGDRLLMPSLSGEVLQKIWNPRDPARLDLFLSLFHHVRRKGHDDWQILYCKHGQKTVIVSKLNNSLNLWYCPLSRAQLDNGLCVFIQPLCHR